MTTFQLNVTNTKLMTRAAELATLEAAEFGNISNDESSSKDDSEGEDEDLGGDSNHECSYSTAIDTDLALQKFRRLHADTQAALTVAVCFGNTFVGEFVQVIMHTLLRRRQHEADHSEKSHEFKGSNTLTVRRCERELKAMLGVDLASVDVVALLMIAVKEGLVEEVPRVDGDVCTHHLYKFHHEDINTALYDLLPVRDRELLHLYLATILWTQMLPLADDGDDHDTLIVTIVDQLSLANRLVLLEPQDFQVGVAQLYLQAARCVRCNGAFLSAGEYLHRSIDMLGSDKWSSHYLLTFEILTLQSEMYFCCGKVMECERTVTEILASAICIEDKLDAYVVLVDCLGSRKRAGQAITTAYTVLSQIGFSTPKHKAGSRHVLGLLLKNRKVLRRYSDKELLAYKECNARVVEGCLKLLSRTVAIAWMAGESNDVAFMSMLMCHISLTRGFTKFSANAVVLFAAVLVKMGNVNMGKRYGKLALELCDRFKSVDGHGQTMLVYYCFIHHMSTPMHSLLDPLIQTNQRATAGGDVAHSHMACSAYIFTYIVCGLPLSAVETDSKEFITQMRHHKQSAALTHARLYRQLALNLIHRPRDPYRLEGSEIASLPDLLLQGDECNNKRTREGILNCQLFLACYLGRGNEGERIVQAHAKLKDQEDPMCYSTVFPYLRAMVALRLARTSRKNRGLFRRQAARDIRKVERFLSLGFVNCSHHLSLLEAEMQAHHQKPDRAVKMAYDKAIAMSLRSGFPQDAGLASHNAACFFRERNECWASCFFGRAVEHFHQWGAQVKISRMCHGTTRVVTMRNGRVAQANSGLLRNILRYDSEHDGDGGSTVSCSIHGRSRKNSFFRNRDHQTTDWFSTVTIGTSTRKRLSTKETKST